MTDKLRDAVQQALSAPGCERLKDWYEIGPAQRAAVETFLEAALSQQDAQAELPIIRQNKLLADALASCILASGIVRTDIDGLTGPQLLLFAEDLREMLETKKAQQEAHAGLQELSEAFRAELDKVSQRNFELRMEIASLKATPTSPVQEKQS